MPRLCYRVSLLLCLLAIGAYAQLRSGGPNFASSGNVTVHIVFPDDRAAGVNLTVHLMEGASSAAVATTFTNDRGECQFLSIPVGTYHIEVSGDGIRKTVGELFEIDSRKISQHQYVTVPRVDDAESKPQSGHGAMVSAADLNVPDKARHELEKAEEQMASRNWKKALEHLNKAIVIAPGYVTAYNELAVVYAKLDDIPHEEEALKKAVSLDGHFAPALENYGKLSLSQKDPVMAEALLQKASTSDPGNPEILMLLAYAQFMNRHFDAAISNAAQAHSAGAGHAAMVHYIAARSYEQENQPQRALAEFQVFLKEEPKGPRADQVRADVAKMQTAQQATTQ